LLRQASPYSTTVDGLLFDGWKFWHGQNIKMDEILFIESRPIPGAERHSLYLPEDIDI